MNGCNSRVLLSLCLIAVAIIVCGARASAQVVINEILPDNATTEPQDVGGGTADMVELFNTTDEAVVLGTGVASDSWVLSETATLDGVPSRSVWVFPAGRSTMPPGGRLVIFCDENIVEGTCELHAGFRIRSDGSEPLSLWGPEAIPGDRLSRPLVDQIWLPPVGDDIAFGRFPDGAGPAPVPPDETFDHLVVYPPGQASFGSCLTIPGQCVLGLRRFCGGAANGPGGGNLPPRVSRRVESTHAPAAAEPVRIIARVRDDRLPTPENIASVRIVYRVIAPDGSAGPERVVELAYDDEAGLMTRADADPPRPSDVFSHWHGEIPGQDAGTRVEFYLAATDRGVDGAGPLTGTRPSNLCPPGVGPCDREFGPAEFGCELDRVDVAECPDVDGIDRLVLGERFIACEAPWTYAVGYEPRAAIAGVMINEVVPRQSDLLIDETESFCAVRDQCPPDNPECCRRDEDFIELLNTRDTPADLSGCWLSDRFFEPRAWRFPAGSILAPGERVIVWLDDDGSRCPDAERLDAPCWWECPDPNASTISELREWHASFSLDATGDQIFLYDREEFGFGLVSGVDFSEPASFPGFTPNEACRDPGTLAIIPCRDPGSGEPMIGRDGEPLGTNPDGSILANQSLSRIPDGDPQGCWIIVERGTPKAPNVAEVSCGGTTFRRADSNSDSALDLTDAVFTLNFLFLTGAAPTCFDAMDANDSGGIDLSDGVFTLNYLFLTGAPPPAPGPTECGEDPTDDALTECVDPSCG